MSSLNTVMTMLASTPYLTGALIVTVGLLAAEAWILRGRSRMRGNRAAEEP